MNLSHFSLAACLVAGVALAEGVFAQSSAPAQQITRAGSKPSTAGPAEFFTGRGRVDPVWSANGDMTHLAVAGVFWRDERA